MAERSTMPAGDAPKLRRVSNPRAMLALSLVVAGVALIGSLRQSTFDGIGRHAVETQATIVGTSTTNGTRYATVQFLTANGALTTTRVAICHHQAYDVGLAVPIRYDSRAPARAWEKEMVPRAVPFVPVLLWLAGFMAAAVGGVVLLVRRRRQRDTEPGRPRPSLPEDEPMVAVASLDAMWHLDLVD